MSRPRFQQELWVALMRVLMIMALCSSHASATIWDHPKARSIESQNKRFTFWVNPDEQYPRRYGYCRGRLLERIGDQWQVKWERHLTNNWAPLRAFVSDDRHVATIGEWGETFPRPFLLALYAPDGELVRIHTWEGLGIDADSDDVVYAWFAYMIPFFEGDAFFIHFHWGRLIGIGTRFGYQLADDAESAEAMNKGRERLREVIPQFLKSKEEDEKIAGIIAAQQLKLRAAIPQMRILLKDQDRWISRTKDGTEHYSYRVRAFAKDALESMGEEVGEVEIEVPKPPRRDE